MGVKHVVEIRDFRVRIVAIYPILTHNSEVMIGRDHMAIDQQMGHCRSVAGRREVHSMPEEIQRRRSLGRIGDRIMEQGVIESISNLRRVNSISSFPATASTGMRLVRGAALATNPIDEKLAWAKVDVESVGE